MKKAAIALTLLALLWLGAVAALLWALVLIPAYKSFHDLARVLVGTAEWARI